MVPPPPQIEGVLKSTIHAIAFGLITTVMSITVGTLLIPNFFVCIVSFVVFIEIVLLVVIPRRKEQYELYQPSGRKGVHSIEGANSPQINIQGPDEYDSPKKKARIRERFHKKPADHKKDLLRPDDSDPVGTSSGLGHTGSPKRSPMTEKKESPKVAKEKRDESKGKPESTDPEERDEEKSIKRGKGSWRKRLPQRKSQSEESV